MGAHPGARLVAGATEIGVELNKKARTFPCLISTEGVPELTRLAATPAAWRIGAAVPLTTIEEALAGEYPSLARMLGVFASRQIRSRATLGGNLATASPIGDSAPVLLTLDAALVLAAAGGERTVPVAEFFTGYRQTVLRPGEIIREIVLPRGDPAAAGLTRRADFLKVSQAPGAGHQHGGGRVLRGRRRRGGGAPGAAGLRGRGRDAAARAPGGGRAGGEDGWPTRRAEVAGLLATEFQPIDDVRGSAAYRRALVVSLWEKFVGGRPERGPGRRAGFRPRRGVARHRRLARPAARERRRPRDRRRAVRGRPGPAPADARRVAGAVDARAGAPRPARRRRGAARAGRGGGAAGRGHPGDEQRRAGAARRAAARGGRGVLPRPDDRAGGGRVGARLPAGGGAGRGGLRAAARRCSRWPRRWRRTVFTPSRTCSRAAIARRRWRRRPCRLDGRVRARRAGALLPRDARGLGRAGREGRRASCVPRPSIRRRSRRWWRRCSGGRATRWWRRRRAWAAVSAARRRRATRSPLWWRWPRCGPAGPCACSSTATWT